MKRLIHAVAVLVTLAGCSSGGSVGKDGEALVDESEQDITLRDGTTDGTLDESGESDQGGQDLFFDSADWSFSDIGPQCAPGDGCFLDPCTENSQCQAGWCVEHMGAGVCSQLCSEECPPGWSCKQVGASDPDLVYVCVSAYSNLCKPCTATADCKSPGGAEDLCLDYGHEGSFCGGACTVDDDCPWGFSCTPATTIDGIEAKQCLADAGVCPCTAKSVNLALWTPCEIENEFGTCQGKRVCSDEGLSACDAPIPAAESCDGIDNDCDGETDEPTVVGGDYVNLCDDGNPCTDDECQGEAGCSNVSLEEGSCDDGEPCTAADHCEAGVCVGSPVACEDNNPCTDDVCTPTGGCDHLPNSDACDDGDACTVADKCFQGSCAGVSVACDCQSDADCGALEDGNLCNGTLYCDQSSLPYQCKVDEATVVACPGPEGMDAPCLAAACEPLTGSCSLVPANDGAPCDDGNECQLKDVCADGTCGGVLPAVCNDGNVCTDDSCAPESGCAYEANQAECSDGNVCTEGDHCAGAACLPGDAIDCDDANPCTKDVCSAQSGCSHVPAPGLCDDGDGCTVGDVCVDGACQAGDARDCDDDNPCTADSCADGACVHAPTDGACDDANVCTLGDYCHEGSCKYNALLDCDDDNVCTDDLCDPQFGCLAKPNTASCDDGNLCTKGDLCAAGKCGGGGPVTCNDNNGCTDDSCDPESGCQFVSNQAACDDQNACTVDDVCSQGWCSGAALDCDDGNLCTDDGCSADSGCVYTLNNVPCDDGNFCTLGDQCALGECVGGPDVPCGDGSFCNGDENCDPDEGCVAGVAPQVDDGLACTLDFCDEEADEVVHAPNDDVCPVPGLCESSTCVPEEGCVVATLEDCCGNEVVEEGETCDDGNEENHDACVGCQVAVCGDGFRQSGVEICDGNELGPETCADENGLGSTGELSCNPDCTYNTDNCIGPLGASDNPAASCKAILDAGASNGNGVYYLAADGEAVEAYCDMSGGGWTLVTSWVYSLTGGQTWGAFDTGEADPSPAKKHAIPFRTIIPSPAEAKFVYTGNNQTLTFTVAPGAAWETEAEGCRITINDGRSLIFERVHCSNGQGICVNSAAYGSGFNCDGDIGQINGQGLFNECTQNEFCNCGTYGWKYPAGGCSATVCQPPAPLAVYLR